MPCSCASSTISASGCTVPISLLAHMSEIRATRSGSRAMRLRPRCSGGTRPSSSTGSSSTLRALVVAQPGRRVEHGVVLGGADQHPRAARVGVARRPEQALDREVVGLGAAAGEDDLAGSRGEGLGQPLAGLLDDPSRPPSGGVQGRRVPRVAHLGRHGLDGLGEHRRRRRVVEVGHSRSSLRPARASAAAAGRRSAEAGRRQRRSPPASVSSWSSRIRAGRCDPAEAPVDAVGLPGLDPLGRRPGRSRCSCRRRPCRSTGRRRRRPTGRRRRPRSARLILR